MSAINLTEEQMERLAELLSKRSGTTTGAFDKQLKRYVGGAVLVAIMGGNGTNLAAMFGLTNGTDGNIVKVSKAVEDLSGAVRETSYQMRDMVRRVESLEHTRESYYRMRPQSGLESGAAEDGVSALLRSGG